MPDKLIAKGKVAGIVADSQLSVTVGSAGGVRKGDIVTLYREVEVADPDSGERLGQVSFPKLRLEVNFVSEKFCVGIVTDKVPVGAASSLRRLKVLTEDPFDVDRATVLITRGEKAIVRRSEASA